jgi:chromosome segregation ATPase
LLKNCGREALYLEEKFGIFVEKIPEYIIQAKEIIDRLEDERQEILRKKQQDREDRDTIRQERDAIVAELEKYGKEIPLIKRVKELETELDEEKKLNEYYETRIRGLENELNDARLEAARFDADGIEIDARWKDTASRLSLCRAERDELKKKNLQCHEELENVKEVKERLAAENKELKLENFNLKTVDKQLAEKDGHINEGNKKSLNS